MAAEKTECDFCGGPRCKGRCTKGFVPTEEEIYREAEKIRPPGRRMQGDEKLKWQTPIVEEPWNNE